MSSLQTENREPEQGIIPRVTWKNHYKRTCPACNKTINRGDLVTKSTDGRRHDGMTLRPVYYKNGWEIPNTKRSLLHHDCSFDHGWTFWSGYLESFVDSCNHWGEVSQLVYDLKWKIKYYNQDHVQVGGYDMGCKTHNCKNCECYGCPCTTCIAVEKYSQNIDESEPMDVDSECESMDIDDGYISEASNEELLQNKIANCNML